MEFFFLQRDVFPDKIQIDRSKTNMEDGGNAAAKTELTEDHIQEICKSRKGMVFIEGRGSLTTKDMVCPALTLLVFPPE